VAITEGTQPTPVHPTGTTATTGAFTPEANSLLVALVAADGTSTATTTASLSDSLSGSWTLLKRQNSINSGAPGDLGGTAEVWIRDIGSSPASMTVTASGWASNAGNLTVRTLIGALPVAQQTGATGGAGGGSIAPTATVTPNSDGSRIYGAALDYTTNATLTANAATTSIDQFVDGTNGDTWATFKGSADTAAGVGQTVGYTNGNAAYNIAAAEILAAATVGNDAPQPMMAPPVIALPWLRAPWMRQQAINGVDVPSAQTFTQSLAGSVTPTGALAKAVTKPGLAGSSAPAGALAKQVNKALAGSVTPTGVLATVKVVLRSFAGSVTPTGSLAKQVNKAFAGSSTATGALTRQVAKALAAPSPRRGVGQAHLQGPRRVGYSDRRAGDDQGHPPVVRRLGHPDGRLDEADQQGPGRVVDAHRRAGQGGHQGPRRCGDRRRRAGEAGREALHRPLDPDRCGERGQPGRHPERHLHHRGDRAALLDPRGPPARISSARPRSTATVTGQATSTPSVSMGR
jgi:hypothetical protein